MNEYDSDKMADILNASDGFVKTATPDDADVILLNTVGEALGFGDVETAVTIFFNASPQSLLVEGTKTSIAERLVEALQDR
jgi:hypothetical protein